MNHKWIVQPGEEDRLDRFISSRSDRSRSAIQKDISREAVSVNGKAKTEAKFALKTGDTVSYKEPAPESGFPKAEDQELEVIYEDEWLLAVNKPYGMIVHPNTLEDSGTLVHALLHHYPTIKEAVYEPTMEISRLRPGIVHRLDKDTTGILLVAKTAESLQKLAILFQEHAISKEYLALVNSRVTVPETVKNTLIRKPSNRSMMGVSRNGEQGREAITHLIPFAGYQYHGKALTLLRCQIETGRTHQIRVHCKYQGHPVIGDQTYTNKPAKALSERLRCNRQLLHAWKLSFTHPFTGKSLTLEAPLPVDFRSILTKLQPADSLDERGSYQLFL